MILITLQTKKVNSMNNLAALYCWLTKVPLHISTYYFENEWKERR